MRKCMVKDPSGHKQRFARAELWYEGGKPRNVILSCGLLGDNEGGGKKAYKHLSPAQARELGEALIEMAADIDHRTGEGD